MKLFISQLSPSSVSYDTRIPVGISYVSEQRINGNGGLSGHPQGFVIDDDNDRIIISWTEGVNSFEWSTGTLKETRTFSDTTVVPGTHIGGIGLIGSTVYCINNIDGYQTVTPNRNKFYMMDSTTLIDDRTPTETVYEWGIGGVSYCQSTNKLYGGYTMKSINNGQLIECDISTLESVGTKKEVIDTGTPNDFGCGIQDLAFFDNPNFVACQNYRGCFDAGIGTNICFWDLKNNTYSVVLDFPSAYLFGVYIIGDVLYTIEPNGGFASTDVKKYNIIYG